MSSSPLQPRLSAAFSGELEILDVLGSGGFATVFRARDPVLQREVAIKVIDLSVESPSSNQQQFLNEARIVATVEHPHIVPLYGAEVRDGLLCLLMRLVPGRALSDRITKEGPLPPADAARIAHEVAQALAAAHAQGVVHRDIKPENILLDAAGHAIVTDFGISLVTGRANERADGMVIGTPQYLSPEQALGEAVDGRADVYSLGVVLYEMLTGRLPFEGRTTASLISQQIIATPPPIPKLRSDVPTRLVELTNMALVKSRDERPTAAAFADALALAQSPEALLAPSVVKKRRRWKRIRWVALGVVLLVAALALAAWVGLQGALTFMGGKLPSLSAAGASVPEAFIAEARAAGSLREGEVVQYAFVPGGMPWSEGMLVTDKAIIRRAASGPGRRMEWTADLSITLFRNSKARGFSISQSKGAPADTLYSNLSGAELGALTSAVLPIQDLHRNGPTARPQ